MDLQEKEDKMQQVVDVKEDIDRLNVEASENDELSLVDVSIKEASHMDDEMNVCMTTWLDALLRDRNKDTVIGSDNGSRYRCSVDAVAVPATGKVAFGFCVLDNAMGAVLLQFPMVSVASFLSHV
nr:uncharacterized protein LOC109160243 isoform X2 [Ipomoea batatas]